MGEVVYPADMKVKIERYCAYQERSIYEVQLKLRQLNCSPELAEYIIADLIQSNFLNEERYAKAIASGKFRLNSWGKLKIRNKLFEKRVSDRNIEYALDSIDDSLYEKRIAELARWKYDNSEGSEFEKKAKVYKYLESKGFEHQLVRRILDEYLVNGMNH